MLGKGGLKDRFENYGAAPNANAWSGISASIPAKKSKKAVIWWWFAGSGIAASILLSFLVTTGNSNQKKDLVDSNMKKFQKQEIQADHQISQAKAQISEIEQTETSKTSENSFIEEAEQIESTPIGIAKKTDLKEILPMPKNNQNSTSSTIKNINNPEQKTPIDEVYLIANKPLLSNNKLKSGDKHMVEEINQIELSEIPLLVVRNNLPMPSEVEIKTQRKGTWQWGGQFSSMYAQRSSTDNWQASWITPLADNSFSETAESNLPSISSARVNRPAIISLLARYSPTPKIFIQINPNLTLINVKSDFVGLANQLDKARLFSIGSDLKVGYKIVNRRRWAIDMATGVRFESILPKSPYIQAEKGVNLWGVLAQVGMNYHLNENLTLRLAPDLCRIFGKPNTTFENQLKKRSNIGFSFSLLKNF